MPEDATDATVNIRSEEFESLYANNLQFETSAWDLKIILGEIDQSRSPTEIRQHTSLTLPWQQAKLTAYYLIINTMIYEATNGKIPFPLRIIPPRPNPTDPSLDENSKKLIAYLAWVHDQFFSGNPYVPEFE